MDFIPFQHKCWHVAIIHVNMEHAVTEDLGSTVHVTLNSLGRRAIHVSMHSFLTSIILFVPMALFLLFSERVVRCHHFIVIEFNIWLVFNKVTNQKSIYQWMSFYLELTSKFNELTNFKVLTICIYVHKYLRILINVKVKNTL